jgi:hypothetical protein
VVPVDIGEGDDTRRLGPVDQGYFAHNRVSVTDEPVHVEAPPAGARWVPSLDGGKVVSSDDPFP